jgi:hypothetical protein
MKMPNTQPDFRALSEHKEQALQKILDTWSLGYLVGYIEALERDINRMKAAAGAPPINSIFPPFQP